jgi:hypothetical protein
MLRISRELLDLRSMFSCTSKSRATWATALPDQLHRLEFELPGKSRALSHNPPPAPYFDGCLPIEFKRSAGAKRGGIAPRSIASLIRTAMTKCQRPCRHEPEAKRKRAGPIWATPEASVGSPAIATPAAVYRPPIDGTLSCAWSSEACAS